jgi:hypothetical protein
MLAWESYVEAQALRARGWSISAIATHTRHDRKTIRAYLNGERRPGGRAPARPEELAEFVDYCRQSQRAGQVVVVVGDGQPRARSRSKTGRVTDHVALPVRAGGHHEQASPPRRRRRLMLQIEVAGNSRWVSVQQQRSGGRIRRHRGGRPQRGERSGHGRIGAKQHLNRV